MSEETTFRYLHPDQQEQLTFTMLQVLTACGYPVTDTARLELEICQQFGLLEIGHLRPEQLEAARQWLLAVWSMDQLESRMQSVCKRLAELVTDVRTVYLLILRQSAARTAECKRLVTIAAFVLFSFFAAAVSAQPPTVATAQPFDVTDLPANARPVVFDTMAALEMELTERGLPTFYSSDATRAELASVPLDCLNGRTPGEAGKKLVAETIAQITPGILALGGTLYPDVSAYFGQQFTSDCIMKFDGYTQDLLAGYGSPAMLVQIDPVLGGGAATMIFHRATGEAQFLFYSLKMHYISNNVMRLDHPAVERESVINEALRSASLCLDYKSEKINRGDGGRNCPFCGLCTLCLNNVVSDANKKYDYDKAGIEAGVIGTSITACNQVSTFLYRAGCLLGVLWGRKIALNKIAEDYNQTVRDKLEQCKKDIAEKTKDLPGGVVRCDYRETPQ